MSGIISIFFNKKIVNSVLFETIKKSEIKIEDFFDKIILNNIIVALKQISILRAYKLKKMSKNISNLDKTFDFIQKFSSYKIIENKIKI